MARLGDVGKIITGNTPKTSDPENYASDDICFVKPSDIAGETVTDLTDSEFYISEHARAKARILPPKSVLVTCIGIIGKVAINDMECAFNQQINAIIPDNSKCLTEYLAYAIQNSQAKLQDIANAPVVPIINKTQFSDIEIRLPPLSEQKKCVERLKSVSKLISLRKAQLAALDQLVKSRFIELFGDPRINPKGYDIVPISSLFDVGSSKRVFESEWREVGVPFYRAREIVKLSRDGHVDNELFIEESMYEAYKEKYGVPKAGDMMVTGVGTLGVCYIVKETDQFYFKDGNTLWFKNKGLCDVRFIKDQYDTDFVKEQITANANVSTVGTYTITNANNTLVLIPPLEEQEQYVEFCKQTDKSKLAIQRSLDELETLKKALMQKYFG